ncbi:WecB/TagA/CpsF family glycosyltransferase [Aetokthonos hydrillicola Thurmond2011]|jgi:exopolysaccharide biosynthesis WecB/TagA/CpsF family protein|uniref:WecB/TagA/CpsF family glycosyltransferase n=1 Tax=Aetokthonos hydrillicola Thurmond2011 TaxID=2712845 RepID=A0AAP5I6L5_9CYAN|nr:WecB/TagA/CpsF family glycosyltransferase [Aetokthonos hydrillicola]MBO3460956.1 WecB/TagA/CpsF family glycosyltransferase [Aetokthonos hydrillicola CCALA 1050]MBW4583628.1 WecB/TagA/CpsF family glycosyltransferase [Aetokthonos hydrillicola CCALA 1050]MDR9895679.1 WecB/TagA/CpsF family glycosyltransferase [Aetokthonos hydrillicola Thurmond2011]
MINKGKYPILGVNVHAVDYDFAVETIVSAAEQKRPCSVSALAVHGVMTGFLDSVHARRLNGMDLIVPDGQPVRWAIWWLYQQKLPDRVYGPNLTLLVAQAFAERGLSVFLYGSQQETLSKFAQNLKRSFPGLIIAGTEPSKFRRLTEFERIELVNRIKASGANAVFLGLGCPRQEIWAYEYRNLLKIPILAVGAAFDFHAGTVSQAPKVLQNVGLEWLYRLLQEPKRLWRRYVLLNPLYLWNIFLQYLGLRKFIPVLPDGNEKIESYG